MALPHSYGRLQFGEDLDLHFRTMIGTGANPNVAACVVIGIEPGWTKRIVDGIAEDRQAGRRLLDRAEWRPEDHHGRLAQGQGVRALRHRIAARGMRDLGALGLHQMRRERHDDRARLLPDCRQHVRQAASRRDLRLLRRDLRDHRRRAHLQGARGHARGRRALVQDVEGLPGRRDRGAQGRRPVREPADQGQHRGRPHHHRGEGARQSREDRPDSAATSTFWSPPRRRTPARASISWTPRPPPPNA